jgi:hypothetical protein
MPYRITRELRPSFFGRRPEGKSGEYWEAAKKWAERDEELRAALTDVESRLGKLRGDEAEQDVALLIVRQMALSKLSPLATHRRDMAQDAIHEFSNSQSQARQPSAHHSHLRRNIAALTEKIRLLRSPNPVTDGAAAVFAHEEKKTQFESEITLIEMEIAGKSGELSRQRGLDRCRAIAAKFDFVNSGQVSAHDYFGMAKIPLREEYEQIRARHNFNVDEAPPLPDDNELAREFDRRQERQR